LAETWSLTLREGYRLREFENRVLRRIFGPKRDEVTGEWTKLHNEELHVLMTAGVSFISLHYLCTFRGSPAFFW
jgi:hypothetical protein